MRTKGKEECFCPLEAVYNYKNLKENLILKIPTVVYKFYTFENNVNCWH